MQKNARKSRFGASGVRGDEITSHTHVHEPMTPVGPAAGSTRLQPVTISLACAVCSMPLTAMQAGTEPALPLLANDLRWTISIGESAIFQLKTATAADQKAWGHAIVFIFLF